MSEDSVISQEWVDKEYQEEWVDEIDKWSAERKAQYRKNGATIASNENLNTEI